MAAITSGRRCRKPRITDDAEIDGNVIAISARVPGHVIEVMVEDEQMVKKGDVLVKLDPKDFEIAVERAKADLNNELANLQTSRSDVPLTAATTSSTLNGAKSSRQDAAEAINYAQQQQNVAQARLSLAQANVKVAEANATKAAQDVERYKTLVAKDEISKQQYDQAVAASEAAKATVDAQKAAVVEAQHSVGCRGSRRSSRRERSWRTPKRTCENAMTGPQQVTITQSQSRGGAGQGGAAAGGSRSGALESAIHDHHGAGRRRSSARRTSTSAKTWPRASR